MWGDGSAGGSSVPELVPWPPRNSAIFSPLNTIMERCNDLLELGQTMQDFRWVRVLVGLMCVCSCARNI